MAKLTPMLQQYQDIKQEHPDAILMFRLGDFYEMFGDDAKVASRVLDIVLTARNKGTDLKIPMCGVPHHAVDNYIARLVKAGHRVAICDQVENASQAKGLVKRDVIRIVTPGTMSESEYLHGSQSNYIASVDIGTEGIGLAVCELSTGEMIVRQLEAGNVIWDELSKLGVKEVIVSESKQDQLAQLLNEAHGAEVLITQVADWSFVYEQARTVLSEHFGVKNLKGFGIDKLTETVAAAGALITYLQDTQKTALQHIISLRLEHEAEIMHLDKTTLSSLEVVESLNQESDQATLLAVLGSEIRTSMGKRLLRNWLIRPLTDVDSVQRRLEVVDTLYTEESSSVQLGDVLSEIGDIQRALSKIGLHTIKPRELTAVCQAIRQIPQVKKLLQQLIKSKKAALLTELNKQLSVLPKLIDLIERTVDDEPAAVLEKGGVIRDGYHSELDELRSVSGSGKDWIKQLEVQERDRTGIQSLKVRYNKVFGYYIEVTKSNLDAVPEDYIRKQTLVNAERFITPELKEKEAQVLGAQERIIALEQQLYAELLDQVAEFLPDLTRNSETLAQLDVLLGLALVARKQGYRKPRVNESGLIEIKQGRHPVIEKLGADIRFVPNDVLLDNKDQQILVITGPNMAGKSTYLRQVALIVLMAQVGSFVPAESAQIGVVDRIFTRVGAQDNLVRGQSTFMVEMQETANILHNATERSLIILDEIGRGTSTFDGLSIAWAVVEYLHGEQGAGPRTLFATHYHELIQLADDLPRVFNFNVAVREHKDKVVFLYQIKPGGVDQSYGVQVAQLAGLPPQVIERAKQVLTQVEQSSSGAEEALVESRTPDNQLALFGQGKSEQEDKVLSELQEVDVEQTSPMDALHKLSELKKGLEE